MIHRCCWLLILTPLLAGCGGDKGSDNGKPKVTDKGADKDGSSGKEIDWSRAADLTLTADELGKEYLKDGKTARKKYEGKVIELTGVVRGMGKNFYRKPYISLAVKGDIRRLSCETSEEAPWNKVTPGQKVKLKVMMIAGHFIGGPIQEVTGPTAPILTAEGLTKEFEANDAEAYQKYAASTEESNSLIFVGEVAEIKEEQEFGVTSPRVYLKTGTKVALRCDFDAEDARALKAGMQLKISGYCSGMEKNKVNMHTCVVMQITK